MSEALANKSVTFAAASRAARTPSTRWALAGLSLSMLLPSLDTSIANSSLPTLTKAFGASFGAVQWIVLAYLRAVTLAIVGAGRLGDRLGRRRLLVAGIAVFTAASLLCGAAPGLHALVAARALQGLGAAVMLAMTLALAAGTAEPGRTGRAIGLLGTMSATGTALGPSLGGVLAAAFGWRAIFLVNVPVGLVAMALVARHVPADGPVAVDARGGLGGGLDLAGTLRLIATPGVGAGLAMSLLVATVIMATLVVGPFHLSRALGLDVARVGFAMSVGPLVAALMGVPAGRLTDRFGAGRMTVVGLGAMAVGSLGVAVMPLRMGAIGYVGAVGVITAGYAVFQTANNTAVVGAAGAERRGVAAGMLSLVRNVGLMAGVGVMGAVFSFVAGTKDLAGTAGSDVAVGTRGVFLVALGVILVAVGIGGMKSARVHEPQNLSGIVPKPER